jgi:hypothetical protein
MRPAAAGVIADHSAAKRAADTFKQQPSAEVHVLPTNGQKDNSAHG